MISAIVIEDEQNSRELLINMVNNYCDEITVIGYAWDVKSGIESIKEKQPDLVFLDIEMDGGNGFDILNQTKDIAFSVIFVTGYNQYAIKAIKYAALDYLLKPVDLRELRLAISKVRDQSEVIHEKRKILIENGFKKEKELSKIVLSDRDNYSVLSIENIIYLEAQGGYVHFFLENGINKIASYSLSHYEEILPDSKFYRIHKSHIINLSKVESYESGRTGNVLLKGGHQLNIAARRKGEFIKKMNPF